MSFIGTNPHHHMRITGGKDPGSIHNSTPSRAGNKMSEPVDDFSWKLVWTPCHWRPAHLHIFRSPLSIVPAWRRSLRWKH